MPYFIYKISPQRTLEKQGMAEKFKEAKALVNELRKTLDPNTGYTVRMIFAENELQAEDLLSQKREPDPSLMGDEW